MKFLLWFFNAQIHFGTKSILWREVIGNIFGLASAVFGARRKIWTWPIGIFGNILLFTVFLGVIFHTPQDKNLYGQAGRQVLFAAISLYGWYRWIRKDSAGQISAPTPRWTNRQEKIRIIPSTILFFTLSYYLLKALGSWGPVADAWIFTGSALATYGLARGYLEFWLVWLAVDAVGVPLLIKAGYYPLALLYAIYGIFVSWGFYTWYKISRLESSNQAIVRE